MRVLLVTLFFPPTRNAGTENYTLGVAESLQRRGHQVEVICAEDWERGEAYWNGVRTEQYKGVTVHRLSLNWLKADNPNQVLYDSAEVESWFEQFLLQHQPDVVHVTSTITLGVGLLRAMQRLAIPVVLTLTDFWFICPRVQLTRHDGALCNGMTSAWDCQSCLAADSRQFQTINSVLRCSMRLNFWG